MLTSQGPIYGFNPPGVAIGTWEVTATVLDPVPEPGTLALVGTGALGLWRQRRRIARGRSKD